MEGKIELLKMSAVPAHAPTPACLYHLCQQCVGCRRVHHGAGPLCVSCFKPTQPSASTIPGPYGRHTAKDNQS